MGRTLLWGPTTRLIFLSISESNKTSWYALPGQSHSSRWRGGCWTSTVVCVFQATPIRALIVYSFQLPFLLRRNSSFLNPKKKVKVSIERWSCPVNFRPQMTKGWQRISDDETFQCGFECLTACARRDGFTVVCGEESHRNTPLCSTCIPPPKPARSLTFDQRPWPFRLTTWCGAELRGREGRGELALLETFQCGSNKRRQIIQTFELDCYTC